jgi:hypothetical protein
VPKNGYVYASDGKTILAVLRGAEARVPVESADIAPVMKQAIVAVEDRRFWEHRGIDLRGILRAVWADVRNEKIVQGGSTITQQLIKNTVVDRERSISRKLKEAALAWQLERRWSKDRILTAYLNTIYFGNGAYGIQQAAQVYFDESAADLTLPQAALWRGSRRTRLRSTRSRTRPRPGGGGSPCSISCSSKSSSRARSFAARRGCRCRPHGTCTCRVRGGRRSTSSSTSRAS